MVTTPEPPKNPHDMYKAQFEYWLFVVYLTLRTYINSLTSTPRHARWLHPPSN